MGERAIRGNDDSMVSRFPSKFQSRISSSLHFRAFLQPALHRLSVLRIACVSSRLFRLASSYQFQNARGERDEGNKVNVRVMAKVLLSTTRNAEPEERNVRAQHAAREGHPRRTRSRSDKESGLARP